MSNANFVEIRIRVRIFTCDSCGKDFYDYRYGFFVYPTCPHCGAEKESMYKGYREDLLEISLDRKTGNIIPRYMGG